MTEPIEYFYNTTTGQVEEGRQSPNEERMGPYATREDAENALAIAAKRNEAWDEADERWENWGEGSTGQ